MARKKALTTGYDRLVAENADRSVWRVGELEWTYIKGGVGINLLLTIGGTTYPTVYARDLKEAGYFAEGFTAGCECCKQAGGAWPIPQPQTEKDGPG